jgi:hypothetical protein
VDRADLGHRLDRVEDADWEPFAPPKPRTFHWLRDIDHQSQKRCDTHAK